jgi:polyisoprenoid-binding protein YceI
MKKLFVLMMFAAAATVSVSAQDYLTRNGKITFHSSTPIEDIDAVNNEVVSTLNTATGQFDFRVAILGFRFDAVDMQKHFNGETYMDSKKYPKASFTGKIADLSKVDFKKDGTYNVTVAGNLTIKNVTKPVSAAGTITVKGGKVAARSEFKIKRAEYNVTGEAIHEKKIGQVITISVDCTYDKR